jgi:SARP family transcriptional regulator, regulator of embCAB operon
MPAHYVFQDGLALPALVAGHPALEFCNTLSGWDVLPGSDYLTSYDHLAVWARHVKLLPRDHIDRARAAAQRQPQDAAGVMERARQLRADLYRVLTDELNGPAFDRLVGAVDTMTAQLRLCRQGDDVVRRIDPAVGVDAPLLAALWSASELLVSGDREHVRTCPGHDCGWLFLDRSGRRRWCLMATCGNRAKARRHAARLSRRSPC